MSYFRSVAITGFTFQLLFKDTGNPITTGTVTGRITVDGGIQTELINSAGGTGIIHEGFGQWSVNITKEEMDGDSIGVVFSHDSGNGVPVNFNIPTQNRPSPLVQTSTVGDPSTSIGQVRILIDDNGGNIFIDAEIQFFLDGREGDTYLAASDAMLVMASSASKKAWLIKTGTKTKDFRKLGKELREQARELARIGSEEDIPYIAYIEQGVTPFVENQIACNRIRREGI